MDSQSMGNEIAGVVARAIGGIVVATAVASIALWELFWWLWDHVSISVK